MSNGRRLGRLGGGTIVNAIVAAPFGDSFTVENMPAFRINGLAAVTSRRVHGRENVEVEFLLERDEEKVAWFAVGLGAAWQCNEWVLVWEVEWGRVVEEEAAIGAGCLAEVITYAFSAGVIDEVGCGVSSCFWGSNASNGMKKPVVMEDDGGKVVLGGEVVGDGLREEDVGVIFAPVETGLGSPDNGGHVDNEVGDMARV